MAPEWLKVDPGSPQDGPGVVQYYIKMIQIGSKVPYVDPKIVQNTPKMALRQPKTAPRRPKLVLATLKQPKMTTKRIYKGPKMLPLTLKHI